MRTVPAPIGSMFGRLLAIREVKKQGDGCRCIECECQCPLRTVVKCNLYRLLKGDTKSCGCLRREVKSNLTHGGTNLPEYASWKSMKSRCLNHNNIRYHCYGGRGITFCEAWNDFAVFYKDMGPRPTMQHTLDRVDVNGNYEPSNCRWATYLEQNVNRTDNSQITYNGRTWTYSQLAREYGIPRGTLRHRILKGRDLREALTSPVLVRGKQ